MENNLYPLYLINQDFDRFVENFRAFLGVKPFSLGVCKRLLDDFITYRSVQANCSKFLTTDRVFKSSKADAVLSYEISFYTYQELKNQALADSVAALMPPKVKKLYNLWEEQVQQGDLEQDETLDKLHLALVPLLTDACLELGLRDISPKTFLEMLSRGGVPII